MGGKDSNYQVIYRGEVLDEQYVKEGGWVFFQRLKEHGGGFWLGRTWKDYFEFGIEQPVSLRQGIEYLLISERVASDYLTFDDDFTLTN